jgi:hypothetical protein
MNELLEFMEFFQGKNVVLEGAGYRIQGRLFVSWNPRRLIMATKNRDILVQDWDEIKTLET